MRRRFARREEPVLGQLHNRVGQLRHLDLGRPPRELDLGLHATLGQIASGEAHKLGRNPLALEVLRPLNGRVVRDRQDPAGRPIRIPAVRQLSDLDHRRITLLDPVQPGDAGIEDTRFDVVWDFLSADQQPFKLGIVNMGGHMTGR